MPARAFQTLLEENNFQEVHPILYFIVKTQLKSSIMGNCLFKMFSL